MQCARSEVGSMYEINMNDMMVGVPGGQLHALPQDAGFDWCK